MGYVKCVLLSVIGTVCIVLASSLLILAILKGINGGLDRNKALETNHFGSVLVVCTIRSCGRGRCVASCSAGKDNDK